MSHMPPVFISYPQDGAAGQALANELFQRLQVEGIVAFLDTESIRLGERWIQALGIGQWGEAMPGGVVRGVARFA